MKKQERKPFYSTDVLEENFALSEAASFKKNSDNMKPLAANFESAEVLKLKFT